MKEWKDSCFSINDIEIEEYFTKEREVFYNCTSLSNNFENLTLVIHGFGNDGSIEYNKKLRHYIAEKTNGLVISVDYHCCFSRPHNGALEKLDIKSIQYIKLLCSQYKVFYNKENIYSTIKELDKIIEEKLILKGILSPPNNEFQNFGILQAIDHIFVIYNILIKYQFSIKNISIFGSSHGGYIGHLILKMMPNSIMALMDNSSYTYAPMQFLGYGCEYAKNFNNIRIEFSLQTKWQHTKANRSDFFGIEAQTIRNVADENHLKILSKYAKYKPQILMVNTINDELSDINRKKFQAYLYSKYNYPTYLCEINENLIDNKIFKSLEHADVSLKNLYFFLEDKIIYKEHKFDYLLGTKITYNCGQKMYTFKHLKKYPYFEVNISKLLI